MTVLSKSLVRHFEAKNTVLRTSVRSRRFSSTNTGRSMSLVSDMSYGRTTRLDRSPFRAADMAVTSRVGVYAFCPNQLLSCMNPEQKVTGSACNQKFVQQNFSPFCVW